MYIHSVVVSFLRLTEMTWKLRLIYRSRVSVPFDSTMPSSFKKTYWMWENSLDVCCSSFKLPISFLWSRKKMPNNLFFFFKKASSFIIIICVYAVNTCFFQVVDYVLLPEAFIWLRQSIITEEKKNSFHRLVIFRARHKVKSKWRIFFFLFRRMKCDRTHPDFFFLLSYLW